MLKNDTVSWRQEAKRLQKSVQQQNPEQAVARYRTLCDVYKTLPSYESYECYTVLSEAYEYIQTTDYALNVDHPLRAVFYTSRMRIAAISVVIVIGLLLTSFLLGFFVQTQPYYCVAEKDFGCAEIHIVATQLATVNTQQNVIRLSTLHPDTVQDVQLTGQSNGMCVPHSLVEGSDRKYVVSLNCSSGPVGGLVHGSFGIRYITSDGQEKTTRVEYRTQRLLSSQQFPSSQQSGPRTTPSDFTQSSSSNTTQDTSDQSMDTNGYVVSLPVSNQQSVDGGSSDSSTDQTKPDLSVTITPQEIFVNEPFSIQARSQATDLDLLTIRYAGKTVAMCTSSPCQHESSSSQPSRNSYTVTAIDTQGNEQIRTGTIQIRSRQTPPNPSVEQSDFVQVQDGVFTLDSQEFRFAGSNAYYLFNYEKLQPSLVTQTLDEFQRANLTVIRMWGSFDGYDCSYWDNDNVIQTAPGVYDEQALQDLDAVIAQGKERGLKFVIPFVNYWDEHGGICQYNTWAGADNPSTNMKFFMENEQTQTWYRDYIEMLLNRENTVTGVAYKDEPAIMAWEIINEGRGAQGADPQILADWYQDIAQHIKSIDQNHLVATGEEGYDDDMTGSDSPYTVDAYSNEYVLRANEGTSYILNTQIPEIDFAGAHWYPNYWGLGRTVNEQYLRAQEAWIADHVRIAQEVGKPFVLGEYGYEGGGDAQQLQAYQHLWKQIEDTPGASGDLLWQYTTNYVKCWEFQGNICWPGGREDQELAQAMWTHANNMASAQSTPPPQPPSSQVVEIMFLGDSLMQAWQSRKGVNDALIEDGYSFDMVGSFTDNSWTDWDSDHQAAGGHTNTQMRNDISSWSDTYQPDIIVLMSGTNDIAWDQGTTATPAQEIAEDYELLLDDLQQAFPNAVIVASSIPPLSSQVVDEQGTDRQQTALAYNNAIQQRVQERISQGEQLVFVDVHTVLSSDDLTNGVYLSDAAYDRLGREWAQGIQEAYDLLPT